MAHLVETMMYVGETPWHGLGMPIPEGKSLTIREAIAASGLDWDVKLRPIFTEDDRYARINILDQYAVCRQKDNMVLGVVGHEYVPLQNIEAFRWFQPFLDAGEATLETAGSSKNGSARCLRIIRGSTPEKPGVDGNITSWKSRSSDPLFLPTQRTVKKTSMAGLCSSSRMLTSNSSNGKCFIKQRWSLLSNIDFNGMPQSGKIKDDQ